MLPLGRLLKRLLAEKGLTQAEFAKLVSMSQPAISQTIRGEHVPELSRAADWLAALNLHGDQAEEFLLAFDLANSPPRIQRLLEKLERYEARRRQQ